MAYLKQIIVENFKSWQGKQVIGPFMRFNCIIGTNGSGKSNVMDALSFAMGERATSLRVKHLRDLVHGAHIGQPVSDSARVTMLFCGDGELETAFSRTITVNSSEYSINGVHVIFGKYTEELKKIGIVTKTQNCLVFQGAVESIALKDPKERTKMLEHISQSKEYAEEYNKKKEAMLKAKEDTQFHFNKKKSAMVERRQVSQEKTEAEKYQALQDHLQQNRMQLSLAELYNNEKAISVLDNNLREGQLAAASKNNTLRSSEQNVKNHKKEHGRRMREQQHIEKEICNQEHLLEQSRSQYIKAKVNTSHLMKKAEQAHKILDSGLQNVAKKEQELQNGQQELAEVETTWRVYEKQVHEEESLRERDVELNEDQLEKYRELKELARKKGAVLNQQAKKMYWDQRADSEKMAFDQRRRNDVQVIIRNHQTQLEDFLCRAKKLNEYTESCKSTLEESRNNEESLSAELQRGSVRCEEVKQELSQVLEELRNAGLENQESKRQLQRRELMEKLRRLYPENVYGRLSELCSPIHKKYQLAVTKVFARYMNAIVVASEKVARECIAFIKEERAEPEMFLPIDYLDVNPLNERLRELPGAKMIVDVVEVNTGRGAAQLRKVIQFVCGNALVCDTIKEARALAYERHQRLTTVALDGTMFLKSGVISGGSSDLRTKARRWNEKDMTHLKERKDQLTTELRDLMRLKRKESDLKQLIAHAQGVQTRMKYSKTDWNNLQEKSIPRCQAEISRMQSEISNLDSQIEMQQESVEMKTAEMNTIKLQIDQIEDIVFKDFCAEVGISSIREYEQEHLKQQAEVDKKRLNFESQCSRLKAKLEYDQDQLEQQRKKLQKMKENINKEEKNMEDQRKAEEHLLVAVDECQNKLQELKMQLISKRKEAAAVKAELDQENQKLQEINKDLVKLQQEVMTTESALEEKRLAKHNLLLACKIQSLPINLASGSLDEISEIQLDADSESTAATLDMYEREAHLVIDYAELEPELRSLQTEEQMKTYLSRLREEVCSLEAVLHRTTAPNLKALEKMREVKNKLQGVEEAFDASSAAARKCSQEFNKVKAQRFHLFSQCFEHVAVVIDQIYKRICRNSSAQAILSADNPEEPYLGGITYSCVAPGKRFMSMDNLSGGEKALAALAWIFAVHSFRPAPFFILDEVDAALDNTNIGKVTSFIREESIRNMQIIVISLKEEFFSKADALLGVYSDYDEMLSSRILTLDLRPYPLVEDDNGKQRDSESRTDRA
ncbi:structural maintenance of chromosomes protein 1B [Gouania willdenowi]|uniref:Structural maintenance of chromosomes protein n=1 Tax=Gouania willdenowi TaxID=441366 RepID=A0A8C5EL54_GOUWI|nr:structural maintenance of chromosomes protein 1B-like [Gouania willdenowi]XP_028305643.1 structural maintenance of chromosomes protein 1B-like [Gouania willdenowi]